VWLRVLAAGWLAAAVPASAHSLLLDASPAAGAVLTAPPGVIALRFNNRIEARLSSVRLVDARGEGWPARPVDAPGPDRLRAVSPPLGPGVWRVEWRVLSTDGHVVSGAYSFRIAP
jgi:methionine-rich copper-binding protein CopC